MWSLNAGELQRKCTYGGLKGWSLNTDDLKASAIYQVWFQALKFLIVLFFHQALNIFSALEYLSCRASPGSQVWSEALKVALIASGFQLILCI